MRKRKHCRLIVHEIEDIPVDQNLQAGRKFYV